MAICESCGKKTLPLARVAQIADDGTYNGVGASVLESKVYMGGEYIGSTYVHKACHQKEGF